MSSTSLPTRTRSLYRRILRELPARTPSILANPSPLHKHIRADFSSSSSSPPPPPTHPDAAAAQFSAEKNLDRAEQYVQYLAAQRMYTTLVERYNPGMNMTEEERVKATARRVGMDLPDDLWRGVGGKGSD